MMNVLVVDDKEENRYALKSLLEEHSDDIVVHLASGGEEALRTILVNDIDIILLDIQMPGMDGFEVARLIKKSPKTNEIPIVFLTAAFKKEEFVKRGYEVGAVDYLTKPIEDYQLINKINLYVDLYGQKRELKAINRDLEKKIEEGIAKLRQKDKILIQQSKMASMGEMIGIIAHQWKQPLNVLSLVAQNLELANEAGEADETLIDKMVGKFNKQISYMTDTIDDFRSFFNPKKEKKKLSLKNMIQNSLSMLGSQMKEAEIEVSVVGEDLIVNSYENELRQVMLSIISNAKDVLTENDIKEKRIKIEIAKEGLNAVILICDNAGGIPEDVIQHVFEPYFTTKGEKGTGIGLYMAKMIICDSMNGDISIQNSNGGACFRIVLQNDSESGTQEA